MITLTSDRDTSRLTSKKEKSYFKGLALDSAPMSNHALCRIAEMKKLIRDKTELFSHDVAKDYDSHFYYFFRPKINYEYIFFDFKNCFPTVALELNYIDEQFFKKIKRIKNKGERMAVLGAPSSAPLIKHYEKNKVVSEEKKTALAPFLFLHLIEKVNQFNREASDFLIQLNVSHGFYSDCLIIDAQELGNLIAYYPEMWDKIINPVGQLVRVKKETGTLAQMRKSVNFDGKVNVFTFSKKAKILFFKKIRK